MSFRQLTDRVSQLEQRWLELNLIPTNSELFDRVRKMRLEEAAGKDREDEEEGEHEEPAIMAAASSRTSLHSSIAGRATR